ncbi:hypothetical protein D3C86_1180600 [compost metagenome]
MRQGIGDALHRTGDFPEPFTEAGDRLRIALCLTARGLHQADGLIHGVAQAVDRAGDLCGRRLRALGQAAHFIGHHREATPLLARPSRLDGGVECQQVGLLGDAANGVDHQLNLLSLFTDPAQRRSGLVQTLIELLDTRGGALAVTAAVGGNAPGVLGAAGRLFATVGHPL